MSPARLDTHGTEDRRSASHAKRDSLRGPAFSASARALRTPSPLAGSGCTLSQMRGAALLVVFLLALVVGDRTQADPGSLDEGRLTVIVGESGDAGPSPRLVIVDADG